MDEANATDKIETANTQEPDMNRAKCLKAIPMEYIKAGEEYIYADMGDHHTQFERVGGNGGSYMHNSTWKAAVANGSIIILQAE